MTSKYDKLPAEEDLVGAGMAFAEATSFLDWCEAKEWPASRAWAFILNRATAGFPKLNLDELSAHLKSVYGDVPASEMGRP